jgi:NAD(P)-dependent dehydrogenase (short-subunit alcohol dehydrogenase family)
LAATASEYTFGVPPLQVNTIVPGFIDTPLIKELAGDKAVLFLMKNIYVTGITLTVDGGRLLI